jgi:hypothetical protein
VPNDKKEMTTDVAAREKIITRCPAVSTSSIAAFAATKASG